MEEDSKIAADTTSAGKAESLPLTEVEYSHTFKAFLQCSDHLADMIGLIEPVVASLS